MPKTATSAARKVEWVTIPAGTRSATCRGPNCNRRIYFVYNPATGSAAPIDADVEGGEAPSTTKDKGQLDAFSGQDAPVFDGKGVNHYTTCPDWELFSRRRHD